MLPVANYLFLVKIEDPPFQLPSRDGLLPGSPPVREYTPAPLPGGNAFRLPSREGLGVGFFENQ